MSAALPASAGGAHAGLDPDAPLRIAYLTYRGKPHVGGQGVYTRHLTKALVDLGHNVEVFSGQPYPILDERIPLHKLPSLDLWNDHFPGRLPATGRSSQGRPDRDPQPPEGHLRRAARLQRARPHELKRRLGDFDLVHDNQCLGYGMLGRREDDAHHRHPAPPDHP
jgi:glycosyltransferase involved in cell wall biosynthesis